MDGHRAMSHESYEAWLAEQTRNDCAPTVRLRKRDLIRPPVVEERADERRDDRSRLP